MIQPSFSPVPYGDKLILNKDFTYKPMTGPYTEIYIPDGFIFEPPFRSRFLTAFLIRDFMKQKQKAVPPKVIDRIFMEALTLNDVGFWERFFVYVLEIKVGNLLDQIKRLSERFSK